MKIRRTRIVVATIILLAAPVALLMAMGCIPPAMTYQGVLTDPSGDPVSDGVYDMEFRLWNTAASTYVFTQTEPVTVTNGIFDIVLGSDMETNPLPVDQFGQGLELEITVEGDTLSPRQTLYGAPYAFTLYPGAVINDVQNSDNAALTIDKDTAGPALKLEGGELESDQDSYWWYDANGMQTEDIETAYTGGFSIHNSWKGGVELDCFITGRDLFVLPLDVPGVLYGQAVRVEEVRVYYRTTNAATYIDRTWAYKSTGAGPSDHEAIASESDNQTSTTATSYSVPIQATSGYTLTSSSGNLVAAFLLRCDDTAHNIYISGVRLRLGHTD